MPNDNIYWYLHTFPGMYIFSFRKNFGFFLKFKINHFLKVIYGPLHLWYLWKSSSKFEVSCLCWTASSIYIFKKCLILWSWFSPPPPPLRPSPPPHLAALKSSWSREDNDCSSTEASLVQGLRWHSCHHQRERSQEVSCLWWAVLSEDSYSTSGCCPNIQSIVSKSRSRFLTF